VGVEGKTLWDRWLEEGKRLWEERGRDPKDPISGPEPRFFTYRQAWAVQFDRSFRSFGSAGDGGAACDRLLDQLASAACFPEVPGVIEALRGNYRVAVLSNADDDFLTAFLERSGLEFEAIVSSEAARSYKPRTAIFRLLCDMLGLKPEQVLYVGDSPLADLLGARSAGLATAWINREGIALPEKIPAPDIELRNLSELLQVLPLMEFRAGRPVRSA
jgi:2-haloalkanoic acid dehalogenase type II